MSGSGSIREMRTISDLLAGYRAFRAGRWREEKADYERLGASQAPNIMVIGCADSRVDPATIFDCGPGQIFVVRNVANLVPPYEQGGGRHGVSAALEFAVTALKIGHIVVMGHGGCGGIAASLRAGEGQMVGEFIGPWVELVDPARERVLAAAAKTPTGHDLQTALEHEAIGTSLDNLMTFPFVAEAVEAQRLELHGAWFAVASGKLLWRDSSGAFSTID